MCGMVLVQSDMPDNYRNLDNLALSKERLVGSMLCMILSWNIFLTSCVKRKGIM